MSYFRNGSSVNINPADNPERVVSLGNAIQWAKAEASLIAQGAVSDEVFQRRKAECSRCPELATNTDPRDEIGFCRACGCGTGARARLSVKLTMPAAVCPKQRW